MSLASTSRLWTYALIRFSSRCKTPQEWLGRNFGFRQNNNSRICQNASKIEKRGYCSQSAGRKVHHPTEFEKKILVYNKTYPSVDAVPKEVTHAQILRAKDWFRIRVNIGMAIATVVACVFVAISGKKAARDGESLAKQNFEMHRKFQEAAAAAAADKKNP